MPLPGVPGGLRLFKGSRPPWHVTLHSLLLYGTLTVGDGTVQYHTGAKDSFNYPLSLIKKAGSADSGKGFYLEIAGAKRYVFRAPAAAEDLRILLNALPKQ